MLACCFTWLAHHVQNRKHAHMDLDKEEEGLWGGYKGSEKVPAMALPTACLPA